MSNNMTRRSFLKCAGAATVAVGAASLLGSCGIIDDIVNQGTKDIPLTTNMGNVNFSIVAPEKNKMSEDGSKIEYFLPGLVLTNVAMVDQRPREVKAEAFTLTVDGHKTTPVTGANAKAVVTALYPNSKEEAIFGNGASVTVEVGGTPASGYMVFKAEDGFTAKDWSTAVLTVKYDSSTTIFTMKKDGDNITYSKELK